MSSGAKSKLKILYMMKILLEKSDEENPLTVNDIINYLGTYDIKCERKSIYADIDVLISFGLDILCNRGKSNKYYIGSRDFEVAELKLLVDAVQSSKFITSKKSQELINKIAHLTNKHQARNLQRQVVISESPKNINEHIFYNVDSIHSAIRDKKKITFKYFNYDVDKQIKYRRDGEIYSISPYALRWTDDRYYLIAYSDRYNDKMTHFRVDRMSNLEVSKEVRDENDVTKNFNVSDYNNKLFKMFSGDVEEVELEFDNSLINSVIDRFGMDIMIYGRTESTFMVCAQVATSTTFFSWLFSYGSKVRIVAPMHVAKKMKAHLQSVLDRY